MLIIDIVCISLVSIIMNALTIGLVLVIIRGLTILILVPIVEMFCILCFNKYQTKRWFVPLICFLIFLFFPIGITTLTAAAYTTLYTKKDMFYLYICSSFISCLIFYLIQQYKYIESFK